MKNLLIGAVLALPLATPAAAEITFISDINNASISSVVQANVPPLTTGNASGVDSATTLANAVNSGVDANVDAYNTTNKSQSAFTNPTVQSATTAGQVTTTTVGNIKTTTTVESYTKTSVAGVNKFAGTATNSQDVSSTFTDAGSSLFTFTGSTVASFTGAYTGAQTVTPYTYNHVVALNLTTGRSTTTNTTPVAGTATTTPVSGSVANTNGQAKAFAGALNSTDYTFNATGRGSVAINYTTTATNIVADGYTIQLYDVTTHQFVGSPVDVASGLIGGALTGTADFSFATAGQYSLTITESTGVNSPDYIATTGGVAATGSAVGTFATTVTSVPEVSTWAMMLAGFAGLGLVGFRRNRQDAGALAA